MRVKFVSFDRSICTAILVKEISFEFNVMPIEVGVEFPTHANQINIRHTTYKCKSNLATVWNTKHKYMSIRCRANTLSYIENTFFIFFHMKLKMHSFNNTNYDIQSITKYILLLLSKIKTKKKKKDSKCEREGAWKKHKRLKPRHELKCNNNNITQRHQ